MIVVGAPVRADVVGVPHLRADPLHQAALEAAAQNVRHDRQGRVVLVPQFAAQLPHLEKRLRHFLFGRQVEPGAAPGVTLGNAGTGSCVAVQPANSFCSRAFISAVSKSPRTASITFAGKK